MRNKRKHEIIGRAMYRLEAQWSIGSSADTGIAIIIQRYLMGSTLSH